MDGFKRKGNPFFCPADVGLKILFSSALVKTKEQVDL